MFELRPYRKNNSVIVNPFKEMEELEKAFFGHSWPTMFNSFSDVSSFKTDIRDEGDHYLLEADLPGFDKNNIQIDLENDTLTINAERKYNKEDTENKNYIRTERYYGKYSRQFDVSEIVTEKITAKYENGVLSLVLPKKEETKPLPKTTIQIAG